eukprot:2335741-Prymnesium_polylepis.1
MGIQDASPDGIHDERWARGVDLRRGLEAGAVARLRFDDERAHIHTSTPEAAQCRCVTHFLEVPHLA